MLKKVLLVLAVFLAASIGYAQELVEAPDWGQVGANAIQVLVIPLTVVVVFFAKKLIRAIPRAVLPVLAIGLGLGLDWFLAFAAGGTFSPMIGALLGASAVWLREFVNTIQVHGGSA